MAYNLCARTGESAQSVGAHRFIRVDLASKYALNGTITVSQSSLHARKVHATIPHWIFSHFAMVTDEVGLSWAVQWRKACVWAMQLQEPHLSPSKVLHCENMEFRTVYSRDFDLDPTTFIYEFDSLDSLRKLSYYSRQTYRNRPIDATISTKTSCCFVGGKH